MQNIFLPIEKELWSWGEEDASEPSDKDSEDWENGPQPMNASSTRWKRLTEILP